MKRNVSLKTHVLTTSLLLSLLLLSICAYVYSSGSETVIYPNSFVKGASFVVINDSGTYKAYHGVTGALSYSGPEQNAVINNALNALTSDRDWKEKIILKGDFELLSEGDENPCAIIVPSYTIIEMQGKFKIPDGGADWDQYDIFDSTNTTNIELVNITFDRNYANAQEVWGYLIRFNNVSNVKLSGSYLEGDPERCFDVALGNGSGISVSNNEMELVGVTIGESGNTATNIELSENFFDDCFVNIHGSSMRVVGNEFKGRSLTTRGGALICANLFENNDVVSYGANSTISDNIITAGDINTHGDWTTISDNIISQGLMSIVSGINPKIIGNTVSSSVTGIMAGKFLDNILISDNEIYNCTARGMYLLDDVSNGKVTDNYFGGNTLAIQFEYGDKFYLVEHNYFVDNTQDIGGTYDADEVIIRRNYGYVTENSGTVTDKANGATFAHGLEGTPNVVTLTCLNSTYESVPVIVTWDQMNTDGTNISIDIYYANGTALTDAVIDVSWYAEYYP